jgi:hypothetical protein
MIKDTYHTLAPQPISWRARLGSITLDARRLLVARQDNADRLPRYRVPARPYHLWQLLPGAPLVLRARPPHDQHAQPDQAVAEEYGGEEDDEDQQYGELAVVDRLRY